MARWQEGRVARWQGGKKAGSRRCGVNAVEIVVQMWCECGVNAVKKYK